MTGDVTIRFANVAEADRVREFGERVFRNAWSPMNDPDDLEAYIRDSFSPEIFRDKLADPTVTFLLAEIDGELAGYAQLTSHSRAECVSGDRTIELNRIYTDTARIGNGIGGRLLESCLAFAQEQDFDVIWLGVWEHNLLAQKFYRRFGFEDVGSHKFVLGSDLQTDRVWQRKLA